MSPIRSNPARAALRAHGFTLIEMLVVMGIIVLLAAAVITVSSHVWRSAAAKKTQAMLLVVDQAIRAFNLNPPSFVSKSQAEASYLKRYGKFPPDELEVFTHTGVPRQAGSGGTNWSVVPGKAEVFPADNYTALKFGRSMSAAELPREHRDLAALFVAIQLYSEQGKMLLDKLDARYWSEGAIDPMTGKPSQFIDRDGDHQWSQGDTQIRWLVDDWQNPLVYYTQRDWNGSGSEVISTNHHDWNRASTEMVRVAGGQPIVMSYGPNGVEQLDGAAPTSLLHMDWMDNHKIDDPLNADNLYSDDSLPEKLAKGIPTP